LLRLLVTGAGGSSVFIATRYGLDGPGIESHCKQDFPHPSTLVSYTSVSQPPGRGPVPGPGINFTRPREVLLEFVILVF